MLPKRKCSLEYSYEDEQDSLIIFEKLIFDDVESFKCTHYKACSLKMIKAYCKVVVIGESVWLAEIKQNLSQAKVKAENLKHLRIYFDEGPCYEFICKSFEVTSEKQKNHFENLNNLL
jgi:hypothetical protein